MNRAGRRKTLPVDRFRRVRRIAPLMLTAVLAASCGFDPGSVPVPGTTVSGETYHVRIQFANTLNLPARAKVMSAGVPIGNLVAVRVMNPTADASGMAVADVQIRRSVRLPSATTAQLRQNTVLGDIFIELTSPAAGFGADIPAGGVIPLAQSKPAMQVEDILSGMSTFIGAGAVGHFQDIVNRVNATMPDKPGEIARIAGVLGADLTDIGANLDAVTALANGIQENLRVLEENAPQLTELLTPASAAQVTASAASVVQLLGVIGALGGIAHSIEWLAPLAASGDSAAKAFVPLAFTSRPFDLNAPSNLNALVSLLRDKIIPFAEHGPKVNVVGVDLVNATALPEDEQLARMIDTLRVIGMVR
ncbi:MlaD family protein [Nocardia pseudovaccinii]|uniref:MlaD family protein n=1 Tax=Nocardia pseudovaccinii TaxID=189540 RepID=UPI000B1A3171|nr:MlaD family protein [Nocardia pseudovaccinii]